MIKEELNKTMIKAMKAKDTISLSTIRLIKSKIIEKEISKKGVSDRELTDAEIIEVLQQMIKQRRQSIQEYLKGKRKDLAQAEEKEIKIINKFLPQALTVEELDNIMKKVIDEVKAETIKDMGKVISKLKNDYPGKIDFSQISALLKNKLS